RRLAWLAWHAALLCAAGRTRFSGRRRGGGESRHERAATGHALGAQAPAVSLHGGNARHFGRYDVFASAHAVSYRSGTGAVVQTPAPVCGQHLLHLIGALRDRILLCIPGREVCALEGVTDSRRARPSTF